MTGADGMVIWARRAPVSAERMMAVNAEHVVLDILRCTTGAPCWYAWHMGQYGTRDTSWQCFTGWEGYA